MDKTQNPSGPAPVTRKGKDCVNKEDSLTSFSGPETPPTKVISFSITFTTTKTFGSSYPPVHYNHRIIK